MRVDKEAISRDVANIVKSFRFLFQSDKSLFAARLLLIAFESMMPLLSLYALKLLIDAITAATEKNMTGSASSIWLYAALFAAVFLVKRVLAILNQYTDGLLNQKLTDFISELVHEKSTELELAFYDDAHYYDTFHRAQQEASYRPMQLLRSFCGLCRNSLSIAGVVAILFSFSWLAVAIMFVAGLPALVVKLFRSKVIYLWRKKNTPLFRKADYLSKLMTNRAYAKEVRTNGLAGHFRGQFREIRQLLVQQIRAILRTQARYDAFSVVIEAAALLGIVYLLSIRAFAGAISLGSFVMLFEAFRNGQGFVQSLVSNVSSLYENKLFLSNLFEFLDLQPQIQSLAEPVPFPAQLQEGIRFEKVCFAYPGSEKWVLKDFCFHARPGQLNMIEGKNGAGKTTMIKLLCRLYECTSGKITIEGIDIRRFSLDDLRKNISVLFQDFVQYDFTVKQNICLGNLEQACETDLLKRAARLGMASEIIAGLPQQYDSLLGKYFENGEELSMGQWQRIALSRAMYKNTGVLVLDEPTSWMDVEAKKQFLQELKYLHKNRIVLMVSHLMDEEGTDCQSEVNEEFSVIY